MDELVFTVEDGLAMVSFPSGMVSLGARGPFHISGQIIL